MEEGVLVRFQTPLEDIPEVRMCVLCLFRFFSCFFFVMEEGKRIGPKTKPHTTNQLFYP